MSTEFYRIIQNVINLLFAVLYDQPVDDLTKGLAGMGCKTLQNGHGFRAQGNGAAQLFSNLAGG